ncbi:DUF2628 domain-containing protein [Cupriavidus basilensis]|uniref:DUF2628 domain-containing protein n=1 Tax=Cupriavidus basilensis TaxID=68895 RepID=A0ABT6B3J0_9BURK|nr:DUF2628 domain-containing protein [Cupriavidus basilensis]MDF3839440.1 DUF2628 domain-containing protein [Cupriavidus basilensis]
MHDHAILRHGSGRLVAVKAGWSWPAFRYGPFWALWQRQWRAVGYCAAVMLGCALLELCGGWLADRVNLWFSTVAFVMAIALGLTGNRMQHASYMRRGYRQVARLFAESEEEALSAYRQAHQAKKQKRANRRRARAEPAEGSTHASP